MAKEKKRKPKNSNGQGSVSKLSGKRAKPYWARSPRVEIEPNVYKRHSLGTFATMREANNALSDWEEIHRKKTEKIFTLKEIYDQWIDEVKKYNKISAKTIKNYEIAFNRFESLNDISIRDLDLKTLQDFFDGLINIRNGEDLSLAAKKTILLTLRQILTYALKHDYIEKNYADFIIITSEKDKIVYNNFSDEEIKLLFKNVGKGIHVEEALIMCYTGMRPQELFNMTVFNTDLDKRLITDVGVKTVKGQNRVIPISKKIFDVVKSVFDNAIQDSRTYLFTTNFGNQMTVDNFSKRYFKDMLKALEIKKDNLKPYSCRHTFADLMRKKGIDTETQAELMGHEDFSTTANNYHSVQVDLLLKAVDEF